MQFLDLKLHVVRSPGWAMRTAIGQVSYSEEGLPQGIKADGEKFGYLTYGAVWGLSNGRWIADLDIETKTGFVVEIGDFSQNLVLARNHFVPTLERTHLSIPFTVSVPPWSSQSWGPFTYRPAPPMDPANIEVRIFAEQGGASTLYSIDVQKATYSR
jgi:hypothetical protein